ncbi:MAG: PAS domain-containing protein, partial [Myxococcaceae bacterium]|nr:PAS domain-containing protein [Myxococcaceae bacterium]
FGYCINPWTRPLGTSGELLQRAFVAAVETGDVTYASSFCNQKVSWRLAKGDPLDQVYRESEQLLEYVKKTRYEVSERIILAQQQLIRGLQGRTARFGSFEGDDFDEKEHEAYWHRSGALMGVCWHHIRRLQAHFMAGDWERALGAMQGARAHLEMLVADLETAEYYHYAALTLAACHESDGPAHREEHLSLLLDYEQRFREWAQGCPENFLCRSALVSAEVARITGRTLEAEELYEQAIRAARESGFIHHEGLAYELASRFHRGRGLELFADTYLREARACYVRWGAEGKVRQIDALHPHLRPPQPFTPGATIAVQAEQLDVLSVVKASQGISEEMVLPRLQETLLKLVCEQAGAQKGCLLLTQDSGLYLHAQASTGVKGLQVHLFRPALPPSSTQLPVSLVHYVHRTRESLLLDDAASQDMFRGDEYLASHRPKSVLCMPILRQGRVVGLLYLENALATGAFPPDRLLVLGMLAAQAAISLENATLYSELQESQGRLQAVLDNTPNILFLKDTQGRYLLANPQYEKLLRVPRQQIIGREDGEFFPEEVAARLRGHDREVLEAGVAQEREEELPQEDGPHTYLFTRFPLRDAAGTPYAVCGVFTDITERRQAERNERFLAEASRKLVTSLEYGDTLQAVAGVAVPELAEAGLLFVLAEEDRLLPAAVVVHSPEGKAKWRVTEQPSGLRVPRALYQVLRQGRPDFGPVDGLPLGALPPECAAMLEALSSRSALGVPLLARGHGLGVLVLLSARGPQGPRLLPLAEELGRRAALALDNARLYAQAQAAIHLRDDFLSVASHELRTPLTPLKLQLQLMEQALRKERPTAPLHRMVKVGMRQVERLEQLVSNLLDVSQMTAGRLKLHTEVVDLSEVVGDVAARFGSLLAHSGCRLELDIRRGVTGLWDRARLDQVVVNLLTNAIKFGQGNPIEVEVEADPRTARLRVRDHGIGIPPEHLSRIFGRFERAVTTRSYGGLGLGLYIASQIVDAHGGAIRVASEAGAGAAFTVELPRNLPEG